jgi:hypothetical protein
MSDCIYPDDEWGDEFLDYLDSPIRFLPADWRDQVSFQAPPSEANDCTALVDIILERPKYIGDIQEQALSALNAVMPVLSILKPYGPPPKTRTIEMVSALLVEILRPTFCLKMEFKRGRPRQCCPQPLQPMFRFTPLDPLHPAYPSGHATQAHATADILSRLQPAAANDLLAAARRVARNREVAGLHYPSDSDAGEVLGKQLVGLLLASAEFRSLHFERALDEWQ